MERFCDICNKPFDPTSRNLGKGRQRYCSVACRRRAHNQQYWNRHHPPTDEHLLRRACVVCGVFFKTDPYHQNALTCSPRCNNARQNDLRRRASAQRYEALPKKECAECGALFKPHTTAIGKARFCSRPCSLKFHGRQASQKRLLHKPPYNKRLLTAEWKRARLAVLQRDNYQCRICGVTKERRMTVHHLFDEHNHSHENLISVCGACHNKAHSFSLVKQDGKVSIAGAIFTFLGIASLEVVNACSIR